MSDDHTHVVVRKRHVRTTEADGHGRVYEPGDPITPTETELRSLPDRFEPIDGAVTPSETPEESATDTPTEDNEADSGDDSSLSADAIDDMTYQELRSLAGDYDDINGNWGADRLRAELKAAIGDA